jgi:hypothetical protein
MVGCVLQSAVLPSNNIVRGWARPRDISDALEQKTQKCDHLTLLMYGSDLLTSITMEFPHGGLFHEHVDSG